MSFPYDRFLAQAAPLSREQRVWTPEDGPMPALYLGHGAPPLLDDELWMSQLFGWMQEMPKPKAVLIVSAHWEHAPLSISGTAAGTPLVYDFGGFERRFYEMTYPTPDATELGRKVAALLPDGEDLHEHRSRGLDHGAWVPLKVMLPLADVPVVQLSLPTQDPAKLLDLGRRLAPLREEGVLVIGSGFMTHGLPFLRRSDFTPGNPQPGWSKDFDEWAADALGRGDVDTLAAYASKAPGMPYAHPTVDHYIPLFVTMGAAARPDRPVETTIEGYFLGLSKRSFQVR
ncbi:MAG: dioxygenase [Hamadaea sp.]|nr:dioxygenase [Hamadaea sp.]